MLYEYIPSGVCSRKYTFDIEDDVIQSIEIIGGCNGNLQGISKLITGMNIHDVINKIQGINCNGRGTSCPDQISKALKQYLEEKGN